MNKTEMSFKRENFLNWTLDKRGVHSPSPDLRFLNGQTKTDIKNMKNECKNIRFFQNQEKMFNNMLKKAFTEVERKETVAQFGGIWGASKMKLSAMGPKEDAFVK